jgi:N,N-dimethylformamidase beta subunit-like, C-terminal
MRPGIDTDPTGVWTGSWRDPAGYPTGTRPENELTGQIFTVNSGTTSIHVGSFYANQPFWRHIPAADLNAPFPEGTLGYEWDSDQVDELPAAARPPGFTQPAGLTELSSTQVSVPERISDYGHTYGPGTVTHNLTIYRAPSGALVFGAGTVQWSWGLDPNHDRQPNPQPDSRMEQATVNLFADMGAAPGSLQAGLVPG